MQSLKLFIMGSIKELREKVTWPKYKSLQGSTVLVLVSVVMFSIFLGLLDGFFRKIVSFVYNIF